MRRLDQFDVNMRLGKIPPNTVAEFIMSAQIPGTEANKQLINSLMNAEAKQAVYEFLDYFAIRMEMMEQQRLDEEELRELEEYYFERDKKIQERNVQVCNDQIKAEGKKIETQVATQDKATLEARRTDLITAIAEIDNTITNLNEEVRQASQQYSAAARQADVQQEQAFNQFLSEAMAAGTISDEQYNHIKASQKDAPKMDKRLVIMKNAGANYNTHVGAATDIMRLAMELEIIRPNLGISEKNKEKISLLNTYMDILFSKEYLTERETILKEATEALGLKFKKVAKVFDAQFEKSVARMELNAIDQALTQLTPGLSNQR